MSTAARMEQLADRWLAMSLRERGLVLATVSVLVLALWHETLVVALDRGNAGLARKVDRQQAAVVAEQGQQQAILEAYRGDQAQAVREELALVQDDVGRLTGELAGVTRSLVPPETMPRLLNDVLRGHPGVRLMSMANLAPERLAAGGGTALADAAGDATEPEQGAESAEVAFYRHGLRLELEGGYSDVVAWLAAVEQLPWQFVWQSMAYEVLEYPLARVVVEIQTVSTEDRWLGIAGQAE